MAKESILLVDDDDDIRFHFQNIIKKEGFLIEAVSLGKNATEKMKKKMYDLAILDIMLPDMRGDELATVLRKYNPSLKIIFITGYSYMDECIKALEIGVSELLLKPISKNELIQAINNSLYS